MKQCVQCRNDLPDSAAHCVFCGSKQPVVPTAGPGAKTVLGYPGMAADVAAQVRGKSASREPPVGGFDQTQPLSNDMFRDPPPGGGPGGAPPGAGGPPGYGPPPGMGGPGPGYGPPPGMGGPGPGYGPPPPAGYGPPPPGMGGHGPGYGPPPGMGGPGPGYGPPPPGMGPGPGYGPPPGMGGPGPGYGPPPDMSGPGYGPPGMGGPGPGYGPPPPGMGPGPGYGPGGYGPPPQSRHPETEPVRALRPPYVGDSGAVPGEPWAESLKTLMLVFGVLLIACFVAPWKVVPGHTVFSWTILGGEDPASAKILPVLLAATGVLAVVLGALPLATLPRGFFAAGIGLVPVVYRAVSPPFAWQELLAAVGAVTLVAGLLLRSQYTGALIGRLLATVGAVCILVPLLVPADAGVPPVPADAGVPLIEAFKELGTNGTIPAIVLIVPGLLALVSLVVWQPPPGRAGAHVIAWIVIAWPLVAGILSWIDASEPVGIGAALKSNLDDFLYQPLAAMAWGALVGYGVATVAGKQLEG